MSDPDLTPDDDTLASEYVLGVLGAEEMAFCAARRGADPAFDRLVTAWEARLMPAAALVPPVPPPPGLLARIEAAIRPAPTPDASLVRDLRRQLWLWRGLSAGLAVACALALFLLSQPAPQVAAVLLPPGAGSGGYLVRTVGGTVRLDPVRPPAVPAGRALELWSLPAGATAPRSLGVLPGAGESLPSGAVPAGDVQLLVSLEPAGGSPSGAPTGPVVLSAELHGER